MNEVFKYMEELKGAQGTRASNQGQIFRIQIAAQFMAAVVSTAEFENLNYEVLALESLNMADALLLAHKNTYKNKVPTKGDL